MYRRTIWKDHVAGVQEGTDLNAANLNNIEAGVMEADALAAFQASSQQVADSIVEQCFEGMWRWRKWKSGIVELWCNTTVDSVNDKTWGNEYASAIINISFPFNVYNTNIQGMSTDFFTVCNATSGADGTGFAFRLKRTENKCDQKGIAVQFNICGSWK